MFKLTIRTAAIVGLAGIIGTTVAACGSHPASSQSSQSGPNKVLATVNGQNLTYADWQAAVNATDLLQGVSMATTKSAEKQQVQQLASEIAVEQYALKQKWTTEASAKKNAQTFVNGNVMAAFGGKANTEAKLKQSHLTIATLTSFMTQQMVLNAAFARQTKSITTVPVSQVQAYYNTHQSLFATPPQDEMRMILVKTQSLAESIMKQLENGGSWKTLAAKYSLDPASKNKGGEYGWVDTGPQSNFVTSFYVEMDKLKPGQYGIAHTQYGYHVIEVQATRAASTQPFSAVKSQLTTSLLQQQQDLAFQAFSNKISKQSHIKLYV